MRRADRFCKMAVAAAKAALQESCMEDFVPQLLGVIVATKYGPHKTTFSFLDDILDYNDTEVSPTKFSHSVHNAAASYIALQIGSRGPTMTITDFDDPCVCARQLARAWLREKRVENVLICLIDESIEPLNKMIRIDETIKAEVLR